MEPHFSPYPVAVFYLTAFIGVALVLYRPRWAFFFIVFALAARNFHLAVFTRSPFLGEFLNLNDLFLWIGVLALARVALEGKKIWAPNILLALIVINLVGVIQSLIQYGFDYEVMQACWGALVFPIMFFIACNMIKDVQSARYFYWAVFLGSVVAAAQHIIFIKAQTIAAELLLIQGSLRTISFTMSGGLFLVISAFYIDMRKILQSLYLLAFWIICLPLIAISYILSFTRTIWIGALMSFFSLFVLFFRERGKIVPKLGYSVAVLIFIFLAFKLTNVYVLTGLKVEESIDERTDFIRYEDTFEDAYQLREVGMETELDLWKKGFLIWGEGTAYSPRLMESSVQDVHGTGALNHVAFSAYLAHYGLIGLIAYGLLLPFLTIKIARRYYLHHQQDYGGAIAMTAMALALFDVFTLLSSNHYLGPTSQVPGMIYGALWGLTQSRDLSPVKSIRSKMLTHNNLKKWLLGPKSVSI
jgi:hypothetical protein